MEQLYRNVTGEWWPRFFIEGSKTGKCGSKSGIVASAHSKAYWLRCNSRALFVQSKLILTIRSRMLSAANHARDNIAEQTTNT
ncbi:hypothetical protein HG530_014096 [Fusarium avenaceum]|nr:hypothetical protein HG530_014096 [Fusarium avenaceum]